MTEVDAQTATRTYFCKQPGCTNEARSPVGRYAYCAEHQSNAGETRAPLARGSKPGPAESMVKRLAALQKIAKEADRWQARAEQLEKDARSAKNAAIEKRREFAQAVADLQNGST